MPVCWVFEFEHRCVESCPLIGRQTVIEVDVTGARWFEAPRPGCAGCGGDLWRVGVTAYDEIGAVASSGGAS